MKTTQKYYQNSEAGFSNPILLVVIVILCIAVGILGSSLYYQKKNSQPAGVSAVVSQPSGQNQISDASSKYVSFVAFVKSRDGNKVTLTGIPNLGNSKSNDGQVFLSLTSATTITKVKVDQKQGQINMSQLPEVPATVNDIKEGYQISVELNEPVDLGGAAKTVEPKKIVIQGGPGFN